MFDFFYIMISENELVGYFSYFKFDYQKFNTIKNKILQNIEDIEKEKQFFSRFINNINAIVINESLNRPLKINNKKDITRLHKKILNSVVDGKKIYFEPLNYFFANDISGFGRQIIFNEHSTGCILSDKVKLFLEYIKEYLKIMEGYYKNSYFEFEKIFDIQNKIIKEFNIKTVIK